MSTTYTVSFFYRKGVKLPKKVKLRSFVQKATIDVTIPDVDNLIEVATLNFNEVGTGKFYINPDTKQFYTNFKYFKVGQKVLPVLPPTQSYYLDTHSFHSLTVEQYTKSYIKTETIGNWDIDQEQKDNGYDIPIGESANFKFTFGGDSDNYNESVETITKSFQKYVFFNGELLEECLTPLIETTGQLDSGSYAFYDLVFSDTDLKILFKSSYNGHLADSLNLLQASKLIFNILDVQVNENAKEFFTFDPIQAYLKIQAQYAFNEIKKANRKYLDTVMSQTRMFERDYSNVERRFSKEIIDESLRNIGWNTEGFIKYQSIPDSYPTKAKSVTSDDFTVEVGNTWFRIIYSNPYTGGVTESCDIGFHIFIENSEENNEDFNEKSKIN